MVLFKGKAGHFHIQSYGPKGAACIQNKSVCIWGWWFSRISDLRPFLITALFFSTAYFEQRIKFCQKSFRDKDVPFSPPPMERTTIDPKINGLSVFFSRSQSKSNVWVLTHAHTCTLLLLNQLGNITEKCGPCHAPAFKRNQIRKWEETHETTSWATCVL